MKFYWVKTHWLLKRIFNEFAWDFKTSKRIVYLTFDDGPTPDITNWTLDLLKKYDAKATFFCIGENIVNNPEAFHRIQLDGHSAANHTYNHLNAWHSPSKDYLDNVNLCQRIIEEYSIHNFEEKLFRPSYGKLKRTDFNSLKAQGYKIIMWDVLSADFDTTISPEQCAANVLKNIKKGSIIIFHDSAKASKNLKYALPQTLEYLKKNNFEMHAIKFAPELR